MGAFCVGRQPFDIIPQKMLESICLQNARLKSAYKFRNALTLKYISIGNALTINTRNIQTVKGDRNKCLKI